MWHSGSSRAQIGTSQTPYPPSRFGAPLLNPLKCKLFGPAADVNDPVFDGIPRVPMLEGTIVIGVPVGNDSFVEKANEDGCAKLEGVAVLKSNVAKFLQSAVPALQAWSLARKSAALFRETLNDILGSNLPDLNFELACLPVRKDGLGLNDSGCVIGAAYLVSTFRLHDLNPIYRIRFG